ncbi:MAG: hypothetical protein ACK2UM_15900 [Anaerolineales bacterium]|jgi:hypothetical protein
MSKLDVNDQLIEALLGRVAPLVERTTGWNLDLVNLRSKVIPKERGYEEILLGRLRDLGFFVDEDMPRPLLDRLVEYLVESSVQAAYQTGKGELLVVRENVDDSNLDGLCVVIAHELVHRGQHINHPEIFQQIEETVHRVIAPYFSSPDQIDLGELLQALNEIQPFMTLIESHAAYIQQLIANRYYPQARIETHFTLPIMIFRLFGSQKLSQYTDGLPAIATAISSGEMEYLYRNPKLIFST